MPGFTEAALLQAGWTAAAAATAATVVTYASYAYAAYSIYDAQRKQSAARDAANAATVDRLVTVRSSNAARRIIYGRTRVAADTIAYICQHGAQRQYVTFVLPIAGHQIESIDDIWFNDQSIGALDGDGYVTAGAYFTTKEAVQTDQFAGGTPGSTHTLTYAPTHVMTAATDRVLVADEGGTQYLTYQQGTHFTVSGTTLTWITDASAYTITLTYQWNTTAKLVRIKKYLGIGAGERDTELETNSAGQWTSAHLGKHVARLHVTLQYDNDIFGAVGVPNITCIVKGKNDILNWATGSTGWTNNAALCAADYLMYEQGFGIDASRINTSMMQAAQTLCDEWVPAWGMSADPATDQVTIDGPLRYVGEAVRFYNIGGGLPSPLSASTTYYVISVISFTNTGGVYQVSTSVGGGAVNITTAGTGAQRVQQRRYTVDGQISTEANLRDNLKLLAGAMSGKAIYSGGQWRIKAGAYVSPVATLDESDLADGAISILPNPRRSDLFNGVRGTFPDPQNLYQSSSFAPYLSSTYEAIDGASIVADIALPLTQDAMRAQRIAKRMLFEHRSSLSISANWKLSTFALQTGDTVYVKLDRYGWSDMNSGLGKVFIVGERKLSPTGTIQMALIETSSAIDAWDYSEATNPDPAPNTTLPDPRYVAPLSGGTFFTSAGTYTQLSDGTVIPYGVLSWDAITASSVLSGGYIEILWKRAPEISWQTLKIAPDETSTHIEPLAANEVINVQMFVYNGAGSRSVMVAGTFSCASDMVQQVNVATSSGNLLADASFVGGTAQWIVTQESGMTDPLSWAKDANFPIPGAPTNVLLYQNGTQVKYAYPASPMMAVVPGQRYAGYCGIIATNCSCKVQVQWFNSSSVAISTNDGNTVTATVAYPNVEANYNRSGVFATAPADAAFARLLLIKYGTASGAYSGLSAFKPFFGPVDAGAIDYPTWNAGVSPSVDTAQMTEASATGMWSKEVKTPQVFGNSARVCVLQFTPTVTAPAEITASVAMTYNNTLENLGSAYFQITYAAETPRNLKDVPVATVDTTADTSAPYFQIFYLAAGVAAPVTGSAVGSKQIGLEAGKTYDIGLTIINDGPFAIQSGHENTIDYASLRIVQIKR